MVTLLALIVFALAVLVVAGSRGPKHAPRPAPKPAPPPPRRAPARQPPRGPDVIGGWLIGHQIARGHDGFPGDPLPHGHLGSPANLAFWGTVFDEDDEDE